MTEYGGGIFLTKDWDFEVNNTGDIRTISGLDELEKDVAFQLASNLDQFIGSRITNEQANDIAIETQQQLSADPRIAAVLDLTVQFPDGDPDTVEVIATVRDTEGDEQELVFEVGE